MLVPLWLVLLFVFTFPFSPITEKTFPFPTPLQQAPSLIEYIKQEEGFRSKPYKDSEGVLTIGYGLNLSEGITRAEAEWLLRSRLDHATHCLERSWEPYYRQSHQTQEALSDMAYQLGCAGLLEFHLMLSALEKGDCAEAKAQALDSEGCGLERRQIGAQTGSEKYRIAEANAR